MYKYNINFPCDNFGTTSFPNINISGFALTNEGWRSKSKLLVNFQLWRSVYLFTSADKTNSNSLCFTRSSSAFS